MAILGGSVYVVKGGVYVVKEGVHLSVPLENTYR